MSKIIIQVQGPEIEYLTNFLDLEVAYNYLNQHQNSEIVRILTAKFIINRFGYYNFGNTGNINIVHHQNEYKIAIELRDRGTIYHIPEDGETFKGIHIERNFLKLKSNYFVYEDGKIIKKQLNSFDEIVEIIKKDEKVYPKPGKLILDNQIPLTFNLDIFVKHMNRYLIDYTEEDDEDQHNNRLHKVFNSMTVEYLDRIYVDE